MILLQTSERATTILRLRTEEEVAAKRARRKKREKEKGKKKGGEPEQNGVKDGEDEVGPIKWEERVVEWCTIRANAKVKSFALPEEDTTQSSKGGIPVCHVWARA